MPDINYVAQGLDGEQIEAALTAIDGVISPTNNGKVLAVENGKIVAKSASEWTDTPVLEPLSVTANGDYVPGAGVDGFNAVHVAVPGGGGAVVQPLSVTQNGTYSPPSGVDGYAPVTVDVSGGGGDIVYVPYNPEYEQGAVSGDPGNTYANNKTSSTTRIRPVDIVDVSQFLNDALLFLWDVSQYDVSVQQYDANGHLQAYTYNWVDEAIVIRISQPNIAIMIRKKNGAVITPSEFASVNLKLVSLTKSVF